MNSQIAFALIVFSAFSKIVFSNDDNRDVLIDYKENNENIFKIIKNVRGLTLRCFKNSVYLPDFFNHVLLKSYQEELQRIEGQTFRIIIDSCKLNPYEEVINVITEKLKIKSEKIHFENINQEITRKNLQGGNITELKFLNSSYNFTADLLHDQPELKHFSVYDSDITEIPSNFFSKSRNLETLEICNTRISTIKPNDFSNLNRIDTLILKDNNKLIEIELKAFDNLNFLRELKITNNINLTTLPSEIFKDLENLRELDLSGNGFNDLSSNLIRNLTLKTFTFSENNGNLSSLPDGFFSHLKNLSKIKMINNRFTSVPTDLFSDTKYLTELNLGNNRLTSLPRFQNISKLEKLYLAYNNLTEININFCHEAQFVTNLDVSYNKLINLPKCNLPNGDPIDKASRKERKQVFDRVKLDVNLSHNNITEINLKKIVEQYNGMFDLNLRSNSLTTINLDYNIQEPNDYNWNKSKIDLNGNQLVCHCNLTDFVKFINKKDENYLKNKLDIIHNDLTCKSPPDMKNKLVSEIDVKNLYCQQPECAKNCTCFYNPESKILKMNCANIGLNSLDVNFLSSFKNTKNYSIELDISGNNLSVTPDLNSTGTFLNDVTFLNLSSNNISQVTASVLSEKLRVLKLDHNKLSYLGDETLDKLYDKMSKTFTMSLHDNPWICECETFKFVEFLRSHKDHFHHQKIMCKDSNIEVSDQDHFMTCNFFKLILVVLISMFATILAIMAAFYYKNKKKIKIWLYSKQCCLPFVTEDELDEDKEYDAFVSFSHKDEDFVNKELAERLENGPKPYKLCMHHRDWLAGEWIEYQIIRSVQESRRTIIVLSRNFLESDWAVKEFRIALSQAEKENRIRVIVIKYGDIGNVDDLDDELKRYITTRTYIEWGDPWFWDKLMYAMPHKYKKSKRKVHNGIVKNQSESIPLQSEVESMKESSKEINNAET